MIDNFVESGATLITSELARVEIRRAFIRDAALTGCAVPADVLAGASQIETARLGTLDALHLATALLSGSHVLLTRDTQLSRACQGVGLAVSWDPPDLLGHGPPGHAP